MYLLLFVPSRLRGDNSYLFRLGSRIFDDLCPFRRLLGDEGGKFSRCAACRLDTLIVEGLLDVRKLENAVDLRVEFGDNGDRRAGGRHDAEPDRYVELGNAGFRDAR